MDVVNFIVTIISILCTVISIKYSIKANRAAKEAQGIKKKLRLTLSTINLKEFVDSYNNAKQLFLKETRSEDWYKGKDVSSIITPFDETLAKYTLLDFTVCNENLKGKIRDLKNAIQEYDKVTSSRKKVIINLVEIIAEELGKTLNDQINNL